MSRIIIFVIVGILEMETLFISSSILKYESLPYSSL